MGCSSFEDSGSLQLDKARNGLGPVDWGRRRRRRRRCSRGDEEEFLHYAYANNKIHIYM
jgi:hypothetical protein